MESPKTNLHSSKVFHHAHDHVKSLNAKQGRLERHSGTGHSVKESPKKGGRGGGTVWGSYEDDIQAAKNGHL